MIGQIVSDYPDTKRRDARQRRKILEKPRHTATKMAGKSARAVCPKFPQERFL